MPFENLREKLSLDLGSGGVTSTLFPSHADVAIESGHLCFRDQFSMPAPSLLSCVFSGKWINVRALVSLSVKQENSCHVLVGCVIHSDSQAYYEHLVVAWWHWGCSPRQHHKCRLVNKGGGRVLSISARWEII